MIYLTRRKRKRVKKKIQVWRYKRGNCGIYLIKLSFISFNLFSLGEGKRLRKGEGKRQLSTSFFRRRLEDEVSITFQPLGSELKYFVLPRRNHLLYESTFKPAWGKRPFVLLGENEKRRDENEIYSIKKTCTNTKESMPLFFWIT